MNPLLVVLPYCSKDVSLAKRLLQHINDLTDNYASHCASHSILLAADSGVQREIMMELKSIAMARHAFLFAETMIIKTPDDRQSWPKGPNFMFHEASRQVMECYKLPFLWLEPDCVPLRVDWLNAIANQYEKCPKRFMGTMATVALSPDLPERHMSGVAVYPNDAHKIMKDACAGDVAFDYASAAKVVGQSRAMETRLIFEIFGSHTDIPTFKAVKAPEDKANVLVPAVIPPEAVLFHRCKDGSLIDLLRIGSSDSVSHTAPSVVESFALSPEPPEPDTTGEPEPKRGRGRPPGTRIGVPESKMAQIP